LKNSTLRLAYIYLRGEGPFDAEPEKSIPLFETLLKGDFGTPEVFESNLAEAREKVTAAKIRSVTAPEFPYTGSLPTCNPQESFWTACFGVRADERDSKGARYEGE